MYHIWKYKTIRTTFFPSSSPGHQKPLRDLQQLGEAADGLHTGPGQPRGLQCSASGQPRQVHQPDHTSGASPVSPGQAVHQHITTCHNKYDWV